MTVYTIQLVKIVKNVNNISIEILHYLLMILVFVNVSFFIRMKKKLLFLIYHFLFKLACNCDMRGSLKDGICDSKDDEKQNLISGRCHCKEYADGPKCNVCKPGYWNLREDNYDGCESNSIFSINLNR